MWYHAVQQVYMLSCCPHSYLYIRLVFLAPDLPHRTSSNCRFHIFSGKTSSHLDSQANYLGVIHSLRPWVIMFPAGILYLQHTPSHNHFSAMSRVTILSHQLGSLIWSCNNFLINLPNDCFLFTVIKTDWSVLSKHKSSCYFPVHSMAMAPKFT